MLLSPLFTISFRSLLNTENTREKNELCSLSDEYKIWKCHTFKLRKKKDLNNQKKFIFREWQISCVYYWNITQGLIQLSASSRDTAQTKVNLPLTKFCLKRRGKEKRWGGTPSISLKAIKFPKQKRNKSQNSKTPHELLCQTNLPRDVYASYVDSWMPW